MSVPTVGAIGRYCARFVGPRFPTDLHAHHAIEVNVCLDGRIRAEIDRGSVIDSTAGFVIAADVRHRVTACRGPMLIGYVDPEAIASPGRAGPARALAPAATGRVRQETLAWLAAGAPAASTPSEDGWLAALGFDVGPGRVQLDPRVERACARLRESDAAVRVTEIGREVGLSRGRLAELFGKEMGVPMRTWRRWSRLRVALAAAFAGRSLTEAAYAAGFADAAHLTRTCRDMLGLPPSRFTRIDRLLVLAEPE